MMQLIMNELLDGISGEFLFEFPLGTLPVSADQLKIETDRRGLLKPKKLPPTRRLSKRVDKH
jgi:hypothetical protein